MKQFATLSAAVLHHVGCVGDAARLGQIIEAARPHLIGALSQFGKYDETALEIVGLLIDLASTPPEIGPKPFTVRLATVPGRRDAVRFALIAEPSGPVATFSQRPAFQKLTELAGSCVIQDHGEDRFEAVVEYDFSTVAAQPRKLALPRGRASTDWKIASITYGFDQLARKDIKAAVASATDLAIGAFGLFALTAPLMLDEIMQPVIEIAAADLSQFQLQISRLNLMNPKSVENAPTPLFGGRDEWVRLSLVGSDPLHLGVLRGTQYRTLRDIARQQLHGDSGLEMTELWLEFPVRA